MPIRARVGRHAKTGNAHCQNWADDQKVVIDLLNRIPKAVGGAGGGLNPRIVAGICSDELFAAVLAFEDKYFPGQRSGFVDPGGPMFQKMIALSTTAPPPAPSPPPPPPPPPAAPTSGPIPRPLTGGEKALLRPIFGDTIDYDNQIVSKNFGDTGGVGNSYTPGYIPNMSRTIWSWDYSATSNHTTSVFVHEMVHVWQSGHGRHNVLRGAYLWLKYDHVFGDYDDSYYYDLDSSSSLDYYNMEQQAQIIQDYYLVSKGWDPEKYNTGTRKTLSDYLPYVTQLKSAGSFESPGRSGETADQARDRIMRTARGRNAP